jgi:hypothetical protein
MNRRIEKKKLLIVEGRDEENFFQAVFNRHLHRNDVQVLGVGGKTKLTENLRVLVNDAAFPDVEALGIVRDADETPVGSSIVAAQSAFESVRYSLQSAGLPTSALHSEFAVGTPRIRMFSSPVWIAVRMLGCHSFSSEFSRIRLYTAQAGYESPAFQSLWDFLRCVSVIGHPAGDAGTAGVVVGQGGDRLRGAGGHDAPAGRPPSGPRSMIQSADLITSSCVRSRSPCCRGRPVCRARRAAGGCRRNAGPSSARPTDRASCPYRRAPVRRPA